MIRAAFLSAGVSMFARILGAVFDRRVDRTNLGFSASILVNIWVRSSRVLLKIKDLLGSFLIF